LLGKSVGMKKNALESSAVEPEKGNGQKRRGGKNVVHFKVLGGEKYAHMTNEMGGGQRERVGGSPLFQESKKKRKIRVRGHLLQCGVGGSPVRIWWLRNGKKYS